jgi:4,5-DOPA dioxygenase extradiol
MMSISKAADLANALHVHKNSQKMPVVFIGHGSPLNALADNAFTKSLNRLGKEMEKPNAILVVSAHWLTKGTWVSTSPNPDTIYDFGGFPDELFKVKYLANGSPETANEIIENVTSIQIHADHEMGLDHGAWSVLKHIYPKADVPVFQMSIDYNQPAQYHYDLAKQLDFLRSKGVLILASGNIVHNLRALKWSESTPKPYDWAVDFDEASKKLLLEQAHSQLIDWKNLGLAALNSIPTPDHYYPLFYAIGLQNKTENVHFIHEEIQMASVSLRSFIIK